MQWTPMANTRLDQRQLTPMAREAFVEQIEAMAIARHYKNKLPQSRCYVEIQDVRKWEEAQDKAKRSEESKPAYVPKFIFRKAATDESSDLSGDQSPEEAEGQAEDADPDASDNRG